jgi:hypothetical protein
MALTQMAVRLFLRCVMIRNWRAELLPCEPGLCIVIRAAL